MSEAAYTIQIAGESGQRHWIGTPHAIIDCEQMSALVSDLTGFKESFLRGQLRSLEVGQAALINPASAFNNVPAFFIKREQ